MIAVLAILAGAALLAWPALLNGYPLVFIDSVSYLGHTLFPEWPWDKTAAYGPFLHLFHWGWSLWAAIVPPCRRAMARHRARPAPTPSKSDSRCRR